MTLSKSRLVPLVCAVTVTFGLAFAAACSGQGEGERCSTLADNNGNDDCAGSFVCTAKGGLNGVSDVDRCCPADRTKATTLLCQVQSASGFDAAPPPDTGTTEAATDTGGADAAKDGGADAPADTGSADAPADG